jgi:glyoxalase family protein
MMTGSAGIHHVTAICSDAKRNVAFYTRGLGLRLVKKTVNFDDPTTWHLYYGDETGRPGTALTFFAWGKTPAGRNGNGMAVETAFIIPEGSLGYWTQRLVERGISHDAPERRFGETVLPLRDPDGMRLGLVAAKEASEIPGWSNGEVPAEHAVRGFHGVTLMVDAPAATAEVLTSAFAFKPAAREGNRQRFLRQADRLGQAVDILAAEGFLASRQGAGSVHHVAFRAADDAAQADMVGALKTQGLRPTDQIDRCYFRSVYFREPGGVLFEIATDEPGFTLDEPKDALGTTIKLPPWYEARRAEIVAALPPIAWERRAAASPGRQNSSLARWPDMHSFSGRHARRNNFHDQSLSAQTLADVYAARYISDEINGSTRRR